MDTATEPTRHRTVPLRESITRVGKGYPDKLVIFRIAASSYWWVRYWTQSKMVKRSTKTPRKDEALQFAKKFYEEILLRERNLLPVTKSPTFQKVSDLLIEEQQALIDRGERNAKLNVNDQQKLKKDLLPFFKDFHVRDITFKHINDYVTKLASRGLKQATIKVHLNLIHKILVLASREGLIDRLPVMPKVKTVDSPRGWFNEDEYELLKKTASEIAFSKEEVHLVRKEPITYEMVHVIWFMTASFLRPSDMKMLRHRNIQIVKKPALYLRITTETSKTANHPVVTMENAVSIYEALIEDHRRNGKSVGKEDFVFFPEIKADKDRWKAMDRMGRQFDYIVKAAGLKKSPSGEERTIYSLRHTAIMFRLTKGEHIDLLTLARNARTSVNMIERFYARHLNAEMNIDKIQSMRQQDAPKTTKKKKSKPEPKSDAISDQKSANSRKSSSRTESKTPGSSLNTPKSPPNSSKTVQKVPM
jgi:integrase